MDQAAFLEAAADTKGHYQITWGASATSAVNNETFDFYLCKDSALINGTKTRRKFGTAADYGSFGGVGILHLDGGEKISMAVSNEDSAGNVTIRNLTVAIIKV